MRLRLLPLLLLLACSSDPRPDVVLLTIDTLRADHVGAYGSDTARTPTLDRLAATGVAFTDCTTPVPITLPAHASLLTGQLPPRTGVRNNLTYALPEEIPTLAEVFADHGYDTAAFVGAFPLDARFGLARGFDHYDDALPDATSDLFQFRERRASTVVARALDWIRGRDAERPLFLWVHVFDPHAPYAPPPGYEDLAPYAGEIAAADAALGELLDTLDTLRSRPRVVAATSDHGEGLGEHGETTHSFFLYQSTLHVPLLLAGAGVPEGVTVADPVSLVDVAPTLLRLAGIDTALPTDGASLLPPGSRAPTPLYAETVYGMEAFGWSPMFARREGAKKVVRSRRSRAFDLAADPTEQDDVIGERDWTGPMLTALDAEVARLSAQRPDRATRQPSPEEAEALAALGYVGGAPQTSPIRDDDAFLRATRENPDPTDGIVDFNEAQRAQDLIRAGDMEAAIGILEQVVVRSPANGWAHSLLAGAYRESGNLEAARRAYERTAEAQPRRVETQINLARLKTQMGDPIGALAHYERAMELDAADRELLEEGMRAMTVAGRGQHALARLEQLTADQPEDARLWAIRARVEISLRRPDAALASVRAARALGDSTELRLIEGLALRQASDWVALETLMAGHPDHREDPNAILLWSEALAGLDRRDEAVELVRAARARFPEHAGLAQRASAWGMQ